MLRKTPRIVRPNAYPSLDYSIPNAPNILSFPFQGKIRDELNHFQPSSIGSGVTKAKDGASFDGTANSQIEFGLTGLEDYVDVNDNFACYFDFTITPASAYQAVLADYNSSGLLGSVFLGVTDGNAIANWVVDDTDTLRFNAFPVGTIPIRVRGVIFHLVGSGLVLEVEYRQGSIRQTISLITLFSGARRIGADLRFGRYGAFAGLFFEGDIHQIHFGSGITAIGMWTQRKRFISNPWHLFTPIVRHTPAQILPSEILGSASIAFDDVAVLDATGELIGSAVLTFADVANLLGLGELIGSETITFADVASIVAFGELQGAGTINFVTSADLVARGELIGSETITFADVATLVATGELIGSGIVSFAATGVIIARGELLGTAQIVVTPTGTLTAIGALVATATITFADVANLTSVGVNAISASETITISATGAIQAIGELVASETITISATGIITALGELVGAETLSFIASGDLQGLGELAGSEAITFVNTGLLIADGQLVASELLSFNVVGDLQGFAVGVLEGSGIITITASGTLFVGLPPIPSSDNIGRQISFKSRNRTSILTNISRAIKFTGKNRDIK